MSCYHECSLVCGYRLGLKQWTQRFSIRIKITDDEISTDRRVVEII